MATIYQTSKGNHIISDSQEITFKGKRYILDLGVEKITDIVAYPLSELTTLGESFDFITRYFPDYERCNEAMWLDDLDCLIDNECDSEKFTRLTEIWGSDPDVWETRRDKLYQDMLERAIENYKTTF